MNRRTDDFVAMVSAADVDPAHKTLAMSFINSMRPLENGEAGNIKSVSNAFIEQAPLILEMYLRHAVTVKEIKDVICDAIKQHKHECQQEAAEQTNAVIPLVSSKTGFTLELIKKGGTPVVILWFLIQFHEPISELIKSFAK